MEYRTFSKTGHQISRVGLGCMGMSAFYSTTNTEEQNLKVLDFAFASGVNFYDTADVYGPETNEILLSKFLKTKPRDKIFLATKCGFNWRVNGLCGKPEYIKQSCEDSLRRLGVDYIDLYYLHRADPHTPIEESVAAMAELVRQGKVKYIGLSEVGSEQLRRAHSVHPITALQSEYSLWTTDIENGIIETCRELGIAIVPYSPLGRGFLTGAFKTENDIPATDWRKNNPRFTGENFTKNLAIVDKVKEIAQEKGCTPAQLCLAWVLDQGDDMFPIPGTTREQGLKENNQAVQVKFTAEERARIRALIKEIPVAGDRYSAAMVKALESGSF